MRLDQLLATEEPLGSAGERAQPASDQGRAPDIVIFDESFVNHDVPFGAFAATGRLFERWNRRGMTTFHSTTYQPNTISTLHLLRCLEAAAPDFLARHRAALRRIESDPDFRFAVFRDLYSRSLAKLASAAGVKSAPLQASGHYILARDRRIFDGVAGVACSIRGHNPLTYVAEIRKTGDLEAIGFELEDRLERLTGLARLVPAVSGASAVEHALKIGLASQAPRDWVLALRGGFGGKTLLALTGTWKPALKAGLDPLYPKVVYVDPFANDAPSALESAFRDHPIGIVELELIQGVGGVRAVPEPVLRKLSELRRSNDCLLFVDEVQTGMFRTGPFVRSQQIGLEPDLLTIGKGTSDMLFPFALTLYSEAVAERLAERNCWLPETLRDRYGYETGLRTVINTLRRADRENLPERIRERSELFARLLTSGLKNCPAVREVRCFGLLIGIELNVARRPQRWMRKLLSQLYLLALLKHETFPVLVGFCQYEPNVLKLTPPLTVTEEEVCSICAAISAVLHRPLGRIALSGLTSLPVLSRWTRSDCRISQETHA
jgi:acetylornithine/succinyldiaminopimelate/putrescine aminotransferase